MQYESESNSTDNEEEDLVRINTISVDILTENLNLAKDLPRLDTRISVASSESLKYQLIDVTVDSIEADTLVDTGCSAPAIISLDFLNRLNSHRIANGKPEKSTYATGTCAKLADNRLTEELEGTWVELSIGTEFKLILFALILGKSTRELILGVPVIRAAEMSFIHHNLTCRAEATGSFMMNPNNTVRLLLSEKSPVNEYMQLRQYAPGLIQKLPEFNSRSGVFSNKKLTALIHGPDRFIVTSFEIQKNRPAHELVKLKPASQIQLSRNSEIPIDANRSPYEQLDINPTLPKKYINAIHLLIQKYSSIFQKDEDDMGLLNHYQAVIETKKADPIRCNYYPLPAKQQKDLEEIIKRLVRNKVLTVNPGHWGFPVFITYTKGKPRMLVDIRKLNALLTLFSCPLPNIRELIRQLTQSQWFTVLDMPDGYFQMELEPESRPKAGIVHLQGTHMFTRVPQGLSTAVAQFMYAINLMYQDIPRTSEGRKCVEAYLDDTLVHGKDMDEMLFYLEEVFIRYKKYGAKLNPRKIKIGYNEINFLGLIIGMNGIKPDPQKIKAVQSLSMPKTLTELRSLIGTINQLTQFLPNCATLLEPFTRLTKKSHREKNGTFKITRDQEIALNKVKTLLSDQNGPVLDLFDENCELILEVDASNAGTGSCLFQLRNNVKRPLGYYSRKFKDYERNYTTTEKEALSIVHSTEFFRTYLLSTTKRFLIRTDHCGLCWLFRMKDYNSKCARWAIKLSFYKFDIEHISGKSNTVADHLSRFIEQDEQHEEGTEYLHTVESPEEARTGYEKFLQFRSQLMRRKELLLSDYKNEPKYSKVLEALQSARSYKGFLMKEGMLMKTVFKSKSNRTYYAICIAASNPIIQDILKEVHSASHLGRDRMYDLISNRFYWPNIWKTIYGYVGSCSHCLNFKPNTHPSRADPRVMETPSSVCEEWELDFCGPFEISKKQNKYVLTAMDRMSRYLITKPTRDQTERVVINFLKDHLFTNFGYPACIKSDNGPCFRGKTLKKWLKNCNVGHNQGPSYDKEFMSLVERIQGTYLHELRATTASDVKTWDEHLPSVTYMYNCSVHSSTGYSPYVLMFGREPNLKTTLGLPLPISQAEGASADPLEELAKFRYNTAQSAYLKAKAKADELTLRKATEFSIGDKVLIETPRRSREKLSPLFKGPYEVVNKWNNDNYSLVQSSTKGTQKERIITVHSRMMRKFTEQPPKSDEAANNKDPTNEQAEGDVKQPPEPKGAQEEIPLKKKQGKSFIPVRRSNRIRPMNDQSTK